MNIFLQNFNKERIFTISSVKMWYMCTLKNLEKKTRNLEKKRSREKVKCNKG